MIPNPRDLRIADFTYELPAERIARYPLPERDRAKLLRYRGGKIDVHTFRDMPDLLPAGTLLIGNESRVIHARLYLPVAGSERTVEIFCLEPLDPPDYARSLGSSEPISWKCLIGGNRRWKSGETQLVHGDLRLTATRGERLANAFAVTFSWEAHRRMSFGEVLDRLGTIPLPPYLNRAAEADDAHRYQTTYARREGSVAAPTAGLHFTPELMERIAATGTDWRTVTLHVGAGTFKPVTSDTLGGHEMHREYFSLDLPVLRRLHDQLVFRKPIVSVGTTSLRCLESLFYYGANLLDGGELHSDLDQWVATQERFSGIEPAPALRALIDRLEGDGRPSFTGYTQLLITPAARLRVVDGLITNFHQPRSTLLLLVAAVVGADWRDVYATALEYDFRFLSFGDGSLLWRRRAGAGGGTE
jgi:S-adenosylmethionine:tRNA ribosyltransferase-isomerase